MIFTLALTLLLIVAALVIDVGFGYSVGRQEQTVADVTALAAARHLPTDPTAGCSAAWDYVVANLTDLPSGAGSPCGSFPSSCNSSTTAAEDYTATSTGSYTITFRYPLPDGTLDGLASDDIDPLLGSRRTMDLNDQCARFGVEITHQNSTFFSGIAGVGAMSPRVTAVAMNSTGGAPGDVANLVSLDPTGCVGIEVNGASNTQNTTEVKVDSYTDSTGKFYPGAIAVDSNGKTCSGGKTTVDAAGAAQLLAEPTSGAQPGQISLFSMAGGASTCSIPACNSSQVPSNVAPQPSSNPSRVTRAPADDAYNCKSSYPLYDGLVDIAGCDTSDTSNGGPYIDQLTATIATYSSTNLPSGFTLFPTCSPSSGTYTGNYWVECPNGNGFKVTNGTTVVFQGNVIFDGNVNQSGGELDFEGNPNNNGTSTPASCEPQWSGGTSSSNAASCLSWSKYSPTASTSTCGVGTSSCESFVYLNGSMTPSNSSYTLNFNGTFVYVTADGSLTTPSNYTCAVESKADSLTSNAGTTNWVAPTDGLFQNLALWSESGSGTNSSGNSTTANFGLAGGGNTKVDGVFFTPCAQFSISGGFTNPQTAQFLTYQLSVGGGSQLIMVPDPQRLLKTEPTASELIR